VGLTTTAHLLVNSLGSSKVLYYYSLYPIMEQSVRFIWGFTADERAGIQISTFITLSPWTVPVALLFLDGVTNIKVLSQGLLVALLTVIIMKTKRHDGQTVLGWMYRKSVFYWSLLFPKQKK
jgi:hypothetical protein